MAALSRGDEGKSIVAKRIPFRVHSFEGGEVTVWYDGCICIKAVSPPPHNDPVEMQDEEAVALAETLLRLVKEHG